MRCAIMQPTYMPWAGYLNLMASVDLFIYLDDVQYERSSWQNRNRVLVNGGATWLTLPVVRGFLGASIQDVTVDDATKWRRKHATLLRSAYARHTYSTEMLSAISPISDESLVHLADLNIALLEQFRERLLISTPTLRSSHLDIAGVRSARLIQILEKLGATEYVTPPGALEYLKEDAFTSHTAVQLLVHDFQPASYAQRDSVQFHSHLSILDVVAHMGWHACQKYVRPEVAAFRKFPTY
jgi:hypothetical protein